MNVTPIPDLAPYLDRPESNPLTMHLVIAAFKRLVKFVKLHYFRADLTSQQLTAHISVLDGLVEQAREMEGPNNEKICLSKVEIPQDKDVKFFWQNNPGSNAINNMLFHCTKSRI